MQFPIDLILGYIILIPFIMFNIAIGMGSFFQGKLAKFSRKVFKLDEDFELKTPKKYSLTFTIAWLVVGIIGVFTLDNPLSLGGFMILIAFRGGANLGKRVVFGIHDKKLIKSKTEDKKLISIVSTAFQIGLIVEVLFLLMWGILYKYMDLTIKTTFNIESNLLLLLLWGLGLLFGLGFAFVQSKGVQKFLLKDEIGLILIVSGRWMDEKVKEKTKFIPWKPF